MQRYTNVAQDALGNVIQGMGVSVFLHGTQTLATIYSDNGVTTIPNPVTTDALGTFFFYAANGRYDLQFAKTGLPMTQLLDVLLEDINDQNYVNAFRFMTAAQIQDVTAGTALVNVAAALQAAIDLASSLGAILNFLPGIYWVGATQIVFKNNVKYFGSGKNTTPGQINTCMILSDFVGDNVRTNNPVNTSTRAEIVMRDLYIKSTVRTAGKGCFADLSSSFLLLDRVAFFGNDFDVIFDQTEVSEIRDCDLELAAAATGGIWLVNGADRTPGANAFFTNRITIKGNEFNGQVAGTGAIGIVDDGGTEHDIYDNNFNALDKHIRITSAYTPHIHDNQFEIPITTCIDFRTTKLNGAGSAACNTVEVGNNFFSSSAAINFITYAANSVVEQFIHHNHFDNENVAGSPTSGLAAGVSNSSGFGNRQQASGIATDVVLGNFFSVGTNPAQGGYVRIPAQGSIAARNVANNGDVPMIQTNANNNIVLDSAAFGLFVNWYLRMINASLVLKRSVVTYSASMTFDTLTGGNEFTITATNGTAFTINAPTTALDGMRITVIIRNASGGALGVITWNAVFKMLAFTSPTNGNSCSIDFIYDGTNWVQASPQSLQIPN